MHVPRGKNNKTAFSGNLPSTRQRIAGTFSVKRQFFAYLPAAAAAEVVHLYAMQFTAQRAVKMKRQ